MPPAPDDFARVRRQDAFEQHRQAGERQQPVHVPPGGRRLDQCAGQQRALAGAGDLGRQAAHAAQVHGFRQCKAAALLAVAQAADRRVHGQHQRAAVFHTERRNVAISGREPGETVTTLKGYGEQIVQGLELGLSGKITPAWAMSGGLLFMDSERKHSAFLDAVRREANPADYGTYTRTDGDELAFTPRFSASLWSTYRPMSALTLGAGIQHVGKSWLGRPDDADRIIPNGQFGKLPAYTVLNLMASYDISPDFTVRLNIDNVTDELYATSANWSGQRVDLGISRSYLLTADIKF